MEFLDVFDCHDDDNNNSVATKLQTGSQIDRKRKLDDFLSSYIDFLPEELSEKKPKLNIDIITAPTDSLIHKIITTKDCKHEVFYPTCLTYKPLKSRRKIVAKDFPFVLDAFQLQAIQCVENNQNVLVSAHTSAGKTVCASYAIALSMKEKRRVIYTTPIKALSNQKYREFKEEFEDVGLLTGDVTIDPNATLLIMTTEILLLMIYKSSSILKEVGWVIYDEIHYMRDKHRGVVWEQSIILMPSEIKMIFLSATIPNSAEFGQWIAHIRSQHCNVIHTLFRPTPLKHYVYPNGADKIYQVVNEKGEFMEEHFNEAMSVLCKAGGNSKSDLAKIGRKGGSTSLGTHCEKLIKKVFELKNDPAIVFSFSKKSCETFAKLFGKLKYSNHSNLKENIELIFENARNTLAEEDRKLPQLDAILKLMKRGICIHHGGMLPILKEITEILFGEGLAKCLFATETFSMGLNMPAKTVIFTDAFKFDGDSKRLLKSGEYIQMAGRAGRRGLDSNGNVILMLDRTISSCEAKRVIMGDAEPLNSSFHLTYNMILNMMRSGTITPEFLMQRSFLQFQAYSELPLLRQQLTDTETQLSEISISDEEMKSIDCFKKQQSEIDIIKCELWSLLKKKSDKYRSFIVPGRIVHVKCNDNDFGWCVIISAMNNSSMVVDCLVPVCDDESIAVVKDLLMATPPMSGEVKPKGLLLGVHLDCLFELSSVVIQKAVEVRGSLEGNEGARREYLSKREEVLVKFSNVMPLLDPLKDLQCNVKMMVAVREFQGKLRSLEREQGGGDSGLRSRIGVCDKKIELETFLGELRLKLKEKTLIINNEELKSRKRILRRLEFITDSEVLTTKGRVACEISTGDVLMLSETLLSGSLSNLTEEQLVSFLSCFVFEESVKGAGEVQEDLRDCVEQMRELASYISRVSRECRLQTFGEGEEERVYVDSFKTCVMEIVRKWAQGSSFVNLNENKAIFDGSIIRCVRRLDELLGQLGEAARVIGNIDLESKFHRASKLIKRGIIFASSLYLANEKNLS